MSALLRCCKGVQVSFGVQFIPYENISIRRFTRFALGEGLAKKETDFAAEVAAAAGN
jgi:translation elongation factor EF-Ts